MCHLAAYVGNRPIAPLLLDSLKLQEAYIGAHATGLAVVNETGIELVKSVGHVDHVRSTSNIDKLTGTAGIAHSRHSFNIVKDPRYNVHGAAHPWLINDGTYALMHNGIIENYSTLKTWLQNEGTTFSSETDSEVAASLIGYFYNKGADSQGGKQSDGQNRFEWAVQRALHELHGTFGLAILCVDFPDMVIGAKRGSPLILGVGDNEYILASDAAAIVKHTTQAVYLSDNEMVTIGSKGFYTKTVDNVTVTKDLQHIEFSLDQIELGGFEHYMLKEIFEQPKALSTCMGGRVDRQENRIKLGGIAAYLRQLTRTRRIILTACGTAFHAALVGEYLFEHLARIPTKVQYASEFRYRNPVVEDGTVVISISQCRERRWTLLRLWRRPKSGEPPSWASLMWWVRQLHERPMPVSICTSDPK